MKNILLALIAANILYFMWGMYANEEIQPGVAVVDESNLGPTLEVSTTQDDIASVGAVLGSGDASDLEAVVGRSCVTIGPFKVQDDADSLSLEYSNEGMKTAVRSVEGQVFVGHWVQIRDVPDQSTANQWIQTLKEGGLTDAYAVPTEEEGLKISLGVFGDVERAEKVELQARSMDFAADITPRMRDGIVHFVDVGLPAGRGATAIVERYTEEMVALRDAATCPQ